MNEEEKEAMLNLEHIVEYLEPDDENDDENDELANIEYNSIKVAVNLIYKLQKENEYLREREEYLEKRRSDIINKFQNEITDTTIPKDKIKETLGNKDLPDEMILIYIETLVSENSRLEDIEDRKVQIEYNNVFNKGVKSVEDKIRDKIKELEKTKNYIITMYAIGVLEELLGDNE